MKRTIKLAAMAFAVMTLGAQPANAQLGKLLKKVQKTVTPATGISEQTPVKANDGETVQLENGGTMSYTLKDKVEFELVGIYGTSTSENYGTMHAVFKVKMLANKSRMKFGQSGLKQIPPKAIDTDGNAYDTEFKGNVGMEVDVVEGIFVNVKLDGICEFKDVKKSTSILQILRMPFWLGYEQEGVITLTNVPVLWNAEPAS